MNPYLDEFWEEVNRMYQEVNWRVIPHNHKDIQHHDTCGLCIIEAALYGGIR